MAYMNVLAKSEVRALPVPEIIVIKHLGGVANPILGKGRPYRVWDGTIRKSIGKALHDNFSSIFTRFRDIAALCAPARHFPTPPLISPKFPHVPLEVGGWP